MGMFGMLEPFNRLASYWLNWTFPNRLPTPEELIEMKFRGLIDDDHFKEFMREYGFDEKTAENLFEIRKELLTAEELLSAKWRGIIDNKTYEKYMKVLGFNDEDIKRFEEIRKFYPSPSDLIRFAVRDVYNEQIVKKYGYDEEFPESIVEDVKKIGMDEKWIRAYWRAHWELPSPTQAYEMLQRLNPKVLQIRGDAYRKMGLNPEEIKTDLDTVRELLKIADYPKYWRDRLIAIAYNPLTRVDLRRIYTLGLINDDELLARSMELGYTEDDAKLLMEFFKKLKHERKFDLVLSNIEKAYKVGMIDKSEFKELLSQTGYTEDEIEFLISLIDYEKEEELKKDYLSVWYKKAFYGLITVDQFEQKLREEGFRDDEINYWKAKLLSDIEKSKKFFTKTEIRDMFLNEIIDEKTALEYLKKLRYDDEVAKKLIQLWKVKMQSKE
jgi:hypothetical protein